MYQLFTDTSANLPTAYCNEHHIHVIPLYYYLDGKEYTCLDTDSFDDTAYYAAMKAGKQVTTSQITPGNFVEAFRPVLEKGEDIIYVCMARRISGSYDSAAAAREQLLAEFPERRIALINTKGAGFGEGITVMTCVQARENGEDFEAAVAAGERCVRYIYQVFTVDDLMYLGRTGRCSNFSAYVGSALNIKPLLKASDDGVIVTFSKIRGRKKAIKALAGYYNDNVVRADEQTVCISHAGCEEDAQALAAMIRESHAPKELWIVPHEPVTGSHLGPGALALFFISKHNRDTGEDDGLY
ncbi:MAG: DegV family protein [Peptococcaceae bacterium]|nr:DegV family protein [Peptococcaceae bacterium]